MAVLASFMEAIEPVGPCTLGDQVFRRFETEPNTLALAVVDGEGKPLGLIERNGFFLKMASHYGRALYARRRVETFMDCAPLVAEAETTAESFFRKVMAAEVQSLLHGFIVTRNGRYAGVGTALAVLQAGFALHRQRAEEMTRLAENLAWAETEAKAALRAKNQFLAVMSHEIRTPLNGVLGVAELIRTRLSQEELRPYVETISRSGESLLRLLTDAIDMSRAETGALELKQEPVRAGELAEAVEALWRPRAEQAGLTFRVSMDAGADVWVLADAVRLKQVLNNLVGNALKFTTSGHVIVRLDVTCDDDLHARLRAEVEDTGPGVSDEHKASIFEPFKTGSAHSGTGAGAGLGLAICRDLARQMDGDIAVADRAGGGAIFSLDCVLFRVPPARENSAPQASEASDAPLPARVLVVDDNATNRFVASKMLEALGISTALAENGQQALDAAEGEAFDAILMDIKMPVMDGLAATHALRARGNPVPIITLTANADPSDAMQYRGAGMIAVVEKPIRPERLIEALAMAASDHRPEAGAQAA